MTKFEIGVGMLATVVCFAAGAQTINVTILDQAGAQTVLQAGRENAEQRNAPSAIAVVDLPAICLLSSGWMMSARQA
jgi:glc operon protein GlcG